MWTRAELKTRAKAVLRKTYGVAFIIGIILYMAGAEHTTSSSGNGRNNNSNVAPQINYSMGDVDVTEYSVSVGIPGNNNVRINMINPLNPIYNLGFMPTWTYLIFSIFGIVVLLFLIFRILIGYIVQVGGFKYFIQTAEYKEGGLQNLVFGFKDNNYLNILITMFLRDLYTFLWTLLFIIPGIIKRFSYAFVPYILADNPKITSGRAIEISKNMTYGHKWNMFVLNLSFIGWYFLGSLAFGIGIAFVWPYENATYAQLYLVLRQDALSRGIISENELCDPVR